MPATLAPGFAAGQRKVQAILMVPASSTHRTDTVRVCPLLGNFTRQWAVEPRGGVVVVWWLHRAVEVPPPGSGTCAATSASSCWVGVPVTPPPPPPPPPDDPPPD